jgi:hypothetical protein
MIHFKTNKEYTDIFICGEFFKSVKLSHPKEFKYILEKIDNSNLTTHELSIICDCVLEMQTHNEFKKNENGLKWYG